ncbi:MAG: Zn-dependent hydrolase, partial [Xanthomonadales bacterium]|nr:Zn-dependent hydrolase [Xanthomonadales bacterium]
MKKTAMLLIVLLLVGCSEQSPPPAESAAANEPSTPTTTPAETPETETVPARPEIYADFTLTADLSHLSDRQRGMIDRLIEASRIMDDLFWRQAYGDREALLSSLSGATQTYARINYGPWDRLAGNQPFVPGVGPKPLGARFYPEDMTKAEFEAAALPDKD